MTAPKIRKRTIIAQWVGPDEFMQIDEEGVVDVGLSAAEIVRHAKSNDEELTDPWSAQEDPSCDIAVTQIEWLNVPAGFVPPDPTA